MLRRPTLRRPTVSDGAKNEPASASASVFIHDHSGLNLEDKPVATARIGERASVMLQDNNQKPFAEPHFTGMFTQAGRRTPIGLSLVAGSGIGLCAWSVFWLVAERTDGRRGRSF